MRLALSALLLSLSLGCAAHARPPARVDPGALVDPGELQANFMMRQRITVAIGDRTYSYDAVLQKRGATLTLVGLTPFGTRAFVVEQRGVALSYRATTSAPPPFPPRYMLIDVQRVFLVTLGPPPSGGDGERVVTRGDDEVRERWRGGRLVWRRFRRSSGEATVDYGEGMLGHRAPPIVRYRNDWLGYSLTIATHAQQDLP